jgi:hypothetical protein
MRTAGGGYDRAVEMKIEFGVDGASFSAGDDNDVCLLYGHLPSNCFETYDVEFNQYVGLQLASINDILSLAQSTPSERVELNYDDETGAVELRVGRILKEFRGLDVMKMRDYNQPIVKYDMEVVMDPCDADLALTAAIQVGDLVDFSIRPEKFEISATSQFPKSMVTASYNSGDLEKFQLGDPTSACYDVAYLKPIMSVIAKSHRAKFVSIQFYDKMPLRLCWICWAGGRWSYWLAPRIGPRPLEEFTVAELKEVLRGKGLPVSGRKAELIERIQEGHQESPEATDEDIDDLEFRGRPDPRDQEGG